MRWPWQRRTPPPTTIPNARPDLWTDEEWAWEMERDRRDWQRIMEPALRQWRPPGNTTFPTTKQCSTCDATIYEWIEVEGSTLHLKMRHGTSGILMMYQFHIPDDVNEARTAWLVNVHATSDA